MRHGRAKMEKRKLKVLQLGKQYYPHIGGIEATMQQIAEGIQGEVDSCVLASQGRGAAYTKVINGVPVYFAKSLGIIASLPVSWDLVRYLQKHAFEYDVIHLHMPFPLGDLACLLSGYKGKLVLYWHSDIVRQKKAMLFYKPLMNWTLRRADAIAIATKGNIDGSPYVKPFEDKCVLIPFGLRKAWEEKSDLYWEQKTRQGQESGLEQESYLRQEDGLVEESCPRRKKEQVSDQLQKEQPPCKLRLLFIGRLVYYKGCSILMDAMKRLKKELGEKISQVELVIVGTGVLESEMKDQAKQAGLDKIIHFLGRASDKRLEKELERCDVLVFPSIANSEAFGLVQLEAMSYGKPVINTSLPTGVPWVSLDKETGLTVPPEDSKALFKAILWMKRNPEECKRMGERARQRVKTEFSQKKMLEQILKLYKELCGQSL
ncbi:MAG: glycosyltransferase [Lachnospiraceae bacterium]|jgi:glycosyltransferase involved in cell wall biosynthesis|nr:glycosyltransferase [Lachnospiraceae bacterium]